MTKEGKATAKTEIDAGAAGDTAKGKDDAAHIHNLNEENKTKRLENETLGKDFADLSAEFTDFKATVEAERKEREERDKALLHAFGVTNETDEDTNVVALNKIKELEEKVNKSDERANKAETARDVEKVYTAFSIEAQKAGMSPQMVEDAFKLSDISKVLVNPDTGTVEGITEAVVDLKSKKLYLFTKAVPEDVGGGGEPSKEGDKSVPDFIGALANDLKQSPEFVKKMVDEKAAEHKITPEQAVYKFWRKDTAKVRSFLDSIKEA